MTAAPSQRRTSWGTVIYTLDGAIQDFFNAYGGSSVTQSDCDTKAVVLVGTPLTPVLIQGQFSYTVVAGQARAHIVQFRAAQSKLDMDIMDLAVAIHPDFAPRCSYHGRIGDDASPLHIYVMDKREGMCSFKSRDSSVEGASAFAARQFQTVRDLARLFAEAWKNPQQVTPAAVEKMQQNIDNDLKRLADSLPDRFLATVKQVRAGLPALFALLPFVLNHGDLSETNILVDKHDDRITGIIDWAEADVSPFGLSLWGLESLLGNGRKGKFHFYDNAEQLRDEFWRIFEAEIGTAADFSLG
ncbi:hypothetical protein PG985_011612 [Apiospora marii]|uniref:uncharacterized protein n=1 Tax=Apiospora marii TaxID=335849 RepID=UPI00312EAB5A